MGQIKVGDYFVEIENTNLENKNAFLINDKWYVPIFGSDTIQMVLDEGINMASRSYPSILRLYRIFQTHPDKEYRLINLEDEIGKQSHVIQKLTLLLNLGLIEKIKKKTTHIIYRLKNDK